MFQISAIYLYKSSYIQHLNQNIAIRTCTIDIGKTILQANVKYLPTVVTSICAAHLFGLHCRKYWKESTDQ